MKKALIKEYNNLVKRHIEPLKPRNKVIVNFNNGAKVEILGKYKTSYDVEFIDKSTNVSVHKSTISNNMWTKTNIKRFIDYKIIITNTDDNTIEVHDFNAKDKKVYIHLDSKALGDTIAWFPYIEEFRKKHQCEMVVSTFHNHMFASEYLDIGFVKPGDTVYNTYAIYGVGWYYDGKGNVDKNVHIRDIKSIPLQQTASDILGLKPIEIKPQLSFINSGSEIEGKYVCIAPHASALAKYWNYKNGWQEIVDYLNWKGYKVVMITQEPLGDAWHDSKLGGTLKNVIDKTGNFPLSERANDIMNAEAFIGVSSGLSWISWACNAPTVMISGFTKEWNEFTTGQRVYTPDNNCSGCSNKHKFDPGDWKWCPEHKDTDRMFECTTSITPKMVINKLSKYLN
jgi:autotransporter strand-loop-strand O-heptosyltransferase